MYYQEIVVKIVCSCQMSLYREKAEIIMHKI